MADATYQPLVYMKQGGDELIVASGGFAKVESGGKIDVESGGDIDVKSGGQVDVESGGRIDFEAGSYWTLPSVAETTAANAKNFGISIFDGTTAGAHTTAASFTIDNPVVGGLKVLYTSGLTTGYGIHVKGTTSSIVFESLGSAGTEGLRATTAGSTGPPQVCYLLGLSASKYMVIAKTSGWVQV